MSINPNLPPEAREKIVKDVEKHLQQTAGGKKETPAEQLVGRARQVVDSIHQTWRFRVSVNPDLLFNKRLATEQLCQLFLDGFRTWDKDELLFICAMLHTEVVLEQM